MCGIVGYTGHEEACGIIIDGLNTAAMTRLASHFSSRENLLSERKREK